MSEFLNGLLDAGINYIDTSPDYGISEERIGRFISARRDEFFLKSKCGCVTDPPPEGRPHEHVFTRENVRAGVEQSLRRMGTDYIDLVQFHHSPSRRTLAEHDAVGELDDLRKEGKLRFIGMSGILPNLPEQIEMGVFDAFRSRARHSIARTRSCSLSLRRREQGRSSVAEWREVSPTGATTRSLGPAGPSARVRAAPRRVRPGKPQRLLDGMAPMAFLLRFTLSHPAMDTTIVGTSRLKSTSCAVKCGLIVGGGVQHSGTRDDAQH